MLASHLAWRDRQKSVANSVVSTPPNSPAGGGANNTGSGGQLYPFVSSPELVTPHFYRRSSMAFDGKTYDPTRDKERLTTQLYNVWKLMRDGRWRTLQQISEKVYCPEASVSARLRDFRKRKFGGHTVEREYVKRGLFKYRVIPNEDY